MTDPTHESAPDPVGSGALLVVHSVVVVMPVAVAVAVVLSLFRLLDLNRFETDPCLHLSYT